MNNQQKRPEDCTNMSAAGGFEEPEKTDGRKLVKTLCTAAGILVLFTGIYFGATGCMNKTPAPAPTSAPPATPAASPAANSAESSAAPSGNTASENPSAEPVVETKYSHQEIMKFAEATAKKQLGEDAMVLPMDEGKAALIDINGEKRPCFIFGAFRPSDMTSGGGAPGLYHVDANTGEVFDNSTGEMVKVSD